jgi:hypothetical protein
MLSTIFHALGRAEPTHIAQDGTLNLRYFHDRPDVAAWAQGRGVNTTNEAVAE